MKSYWLPVSQHNYHRFPFVCKQMHMYWCEFRTPINLQKEMAALVGALLKNSRWIGKCKIQEELNTF